MAVSIKGPGTPISLLDLQNYFGGDSPISFSEYLEAVQGIGDSSTGADLNSFYGKSGYYGDRAVLVGGATDINNWPSTHPVSGAPIFTFAAPTGHFQNYFAFGQLIDISTTGNATMYGLPSSVDPSFPPGTSQPRPRSSTTGDGYSHAQQASNRSIGVYGNHHINGYDPSSTKTSGLAYTSYINPENTFGDFGYSMEMGVSRASVSNGSKGVFNFGRTTFKIPSPYVPNYGHFWSQAFQVTIGTSGSITAVSGYDIRPTHWGPNIPNASTNNVNQPNVLLGQIGLSPELRGDLNPSPSIFDRIWSVDNNLHTHTSVGSPSTSPSNPDGYVDYVGDAYTGASNGVRGAFLGLNTTSGRSIISNDIRTFNIEVPEAQSVKIGEITCPPWDPMLWDTVPPSDPFAYSSNLFGFWNSPSQPYTNHYTTYTLGQRIFYSATGGKNRAIISGGRDLWERTSGPFSDARSPTSGTFFGQQMGQQAITYTSPLLQKRIDYFDINKTGANTADFGDLATRRQMHGTTTNGDRVIFAGGRAYFHHFTFPANNHPTPGNQGYATTIGLDLRTTFYDTEAWVGDIEYINIHTLGNASNFGDMVRKTAGYSVGSGSSTA